MASKDSNNPVPDHNIEYPSDGDFNAICGIYTCECPGARRPSGCKGRAEQQ
jgi:hypothetical protein